MNEEKNISLEEIARDLQSGFFSLQDLSEKRSWLAGEYFYLNAQLAEILKVKPAKWNELRREAKSDASAERIWQATLDGLKEVELRLTLKSIEKMLSSIRTQIEIQLSELKMQI